MEFEEFFYGVTLNEPGASVTWSPNKDQLSPINKLHVKQILLGHTANADEYNVVQVETVSFNEPLKIPIAVLKVGENRSVLTHLEFPDSVVFKLVEGSGPVYIHGNQSPITYAENENVEEELHDEAVEEEEEEEEAAAVPPPNKKFKGTENGSKAHSKGNAQKKKNH